MNAFISRASLMFGLFAFIHGTCAKAQVQQQPPPPQTSEFFETAYAKARQKCVALWSDHAFDFFAKNYRWGRRTEQLLQC